nr:zinc finger, CCHC-type [Tanacetum cinerariifolium]
MGYAPNNVPFAPKLKTPPPPKKDNPAKDAICHQCGEVGHWKRRCTMYLTELMKKKKLSQGASTSGSTGKGPAKENLRAEFMLGVEWGIAQRPYQENTRQNVVASQSVMCKSRGHKHLLLHKVPFQVIDALNQSFSDGKFDLVCSMESKEHMPDKLKVQFTIREILLGSNEKETYVWVLESLASAVMNHFEDVLYADNVASDTYRVTYIDDLINSCTSLKNSINKRLTRIRQTALELGETMTTLIRNNSIFRSFFEKQKLNGPNFIDWYRQLRLLSTEDKKIFLEHHIPEAPVAPPGQHVPPAAAAAHTG